MSTNLAIGVAKEIKKVLVFLNENFKEWRCASCGTTGSPVELFWDKDGDMRCPDCGSCEVNLIGR